MSIFVVVHNVPRDTVIKAFCFNFSLVPGGGKVLCCWKAREGSTGHLIEKGQSDFFSSLLKRWEVVFFQHFGDTSWLSRFVVLANEACCSSLHLFQFFNLKQMLRIQAMISQERGMLHGESVLGSAEHFS